jgi:hypothetical protein
LQVERCRVCPACKLSVGSDEWVRFSSGFYHPRCRPFVKDESFDGSVRPTNRVWRYKEPLPGSKG